MAKRQRSLLLLALGVSLVFVLGDHARGQTGRADVAPKNPTVAEAPKGNELDYEKVPVSMLLDLLSQLSGKHYILDANLDGVPPVSVNATGLTKDASIKLITATLLLNGVAIMPVDDQTMKVVTVGTNKNPRSEGMRVYTNAADLPGDDEIVAYYMALDHISPQEAAGIFTQVAPVHTYGAYVPATSAQGVMLIENASVIRELIDLKKSIDVRNPPNVPPAPGRPDRPGPPPGPPGAPGFRPPPRHHPVLFLLIVAAVGIASFYAGRRSGRRKLNP